MTVLVLLGLFSVLVGGLIGCIGVGGVLLVPAMVYLAGLDIRTAVAAAMFSYLFTGLIGASIYARHGSIRWSMALWLCLAAMPAAFIGAWASNVVPPDWLKLFIAILVLLAGLNAWRPTPESATGRETLSRSGLLGSGAVTGLGSALSGTGGPLILVPLLLSLNLPVLTVIGLSQAIQLPIAALATAGNLTYGRLDPILGLTIAAGLALGSVIGAKLAHRLAVDRLRPLVALVLVLVGIGLIGELAWRWTTSV